MLVLEVDVVGGEDEVGFVSRVLCLWDSRIPRGSQGH